MPHSSAAAASDAALGTPFARVRSASGTRRGSATAGAARLGATEAPRDWQPGVDARERHPDPRRRRGDGAPGGRWESRPEPAPAGRAGRQKTQATSTAVASSAMTIERRMGAPATR